MKHVKGLASALCFFLAFLLTPFLLPSTAQANAPSLRAAQSVVKILIKEKSGDGSCSGWIYMDTNVITAGHCAEADLVSAAACLYPDTECRRPVPLTLVKADHTQDVALFHLPKGVSAPSVILNSRPLELGDPVLAVGFPFGKLAVTQGYYTQRNPAEDLWDHVHVSWLQHSAATGPGSSGGALFDDDGRLVGMIVGAENFRGGYSFGIAVPIDVILSVVNS